MFPVDLRFQFDAQLDGALLRFSKAHHGLKDGFSFWAGPSSKLEAPTSQQDQMVPMRSGRLHVLLGRNGSGKTRFLTGLRSLDDAGAAYPAVSLIMAVPDDLEHERWSSAIDEALRSEWLSGADPDVPAEYLISGQSPPVMSALRNGLDSLGPTDVQPELGMSAQDVLEFFGCSESEIDGWRKRTSYRDQLVAHGFTDPGGPPDWSFRELAPEFLLRGSQALPHNRSDGSVPIPWESWVIHGAGQWFNQPALRDLVIPAVREFLATATHLEILGGGQIRLLAPQPDGGALRELAEHRRAASREAGTLPTRYPFPLGLVEIAEIGSRPYVASFPIPVWPGRLFDVVDVSPNETIGRRLQDIIRSLTAQVLGFRLSVAEDSASLAITGLQHLGEVVSDVAETLRDCEIGMSGLELHWPPVGGRVWMKSGDSSWVSVGGIPQEVAPSVVWRDAVTGEVLPLDDASEGQQQVTALFLQLALIRVQRHQAERAGSSLPGHTLLVGDEFDRNLHPSASVRVLEALSTSLAELAGVTAIVSTHGVTALSGGVLRDAERLFASRGPEGFRYFSSSDSSLEVMADVLGSTFLDALRLKRLHLVVEGNHDELVIGDVLKDQIPEIPDIDIVNGRGLYAWSGIFATSLRFLDAPVLLVHDKRNPALEEEWNRCKQTHVRTGRLPAWDDTGLSAMLGDLRARKRDGRSKRSDGELEKLLWFLYNNAFDRNSDQAQRIFIFGLDCDDIVDLLPIKAFPKAKRFSSWQKAHADFDAQRSRADGEKFKREFGITDDSVRRAIEQNRDSVHPELVRLVGVVRELLAK